MNEELYSMVSSLDTCEQIFLYNYLHQKIDKGRIKINGEYSYLILKFRYNIDLEILKKIDDLNFAQILFIKNSCTKPKFLEKEGKMMYNVLKDKEYKCGNTVAIKMIDEDKSVDVVSVHKINKYVCNNYLYEEEFKISIEDDEFFVLFRAL